MAELAARFPRGRCAPAASNRSPGHPAPADHPAPRRPSLDLRRIAGPRRDRLPQRVLSDPVVPRAAAPWLRSAAQPFRQRRAAPAGAAAPPRRRGAHRCSNQAMQMAGRRPG
eukprot:CAMPEP_0175600200 /NCGR_PEP_ID=MMETSP0096-20121207/57459_1 /TAXON_ID=311494 /ORGANISM="Alexandrium monilatum, Strain CCMP3105" /LENGTH=111 /DNA_ID=CAMNT_0016904755 /DNA_START=163 /DNA_END=494 /DNA_ORIENTATION=+